MAAINAKVDLGNVKSVDELKRYTSIALRDIQTQMNGNLTFGANIKCRFLDVQFNTANFMTPVPHGLGQVPVMWTSGNISASSVVYQTQSADATNLYLAASAVCSVRIMVI